MIMDIKFPESFKKCKTKTPPINKENVPQIGVEPVIYGQDRTIQRLFGEPDIKYPEPVIKQNSDNK